MLELIKATSGIKGLDTLLPTTFLVKGALIDNEPGVFVSFDERPGVNVASLGHNGDDQSGVAIKSGVQLIGIPAVETGRGGA